MKAPLPVLLTAWVIPYPSILAALHWTDVEIIVRVLATICAVLLMFKRSGREASPKTRRESGNSRRVCPKCRRKG